MSLEPKVVVDANPALLAGKKKDPAMAADAKQQFITKLLDALFINVKHHEDAPDLFEFDPRATSSDIDWMLDVLNAERKIIRKREINDRAALMVEAKKRNGV